MKRVKPEKTIKDAKETAAFAHAQINKFSKVIAGLSSSISSHQDIENLEDKKAAKKHVNNGVKKMINAAQSGNPDKVNQLRDELLSKISNLKK